MKRILLLALFALSLSAIFAAAQSPSPMVIVPAAKPATASAAPSAAASADNDAAVLELLQQIKAANAEVLKRQATVLEQLAEMEKAADQIKIYSKRG